MKQTKFKVCYTIVDSKGLFDTKEEAEKVLNQLQETSEYDDCWIEEETFEETPEAPKPKCYAIIAKNNDTQQWVKLKQFDTEKEASAFMDNNQEKFKYPYDIKNTAIIDLYN